MSFLFWAGIFCLLPACLFANPTGGSVVAGSARIAGQGTSAVTINQASKITIIDWQSFSINSGEPTTFFQPSAGSAALNRVLGGQMSLIDGTLSANGQVYLVNGNGVIIGPGGVVNAGAFTASTRDITNANFLSGDLHFAGSSDAGVSNLGMITALEGNVVLIGRTVDNEGTITAPLGTAALVAADDVLLDQRNADGSTITVSPVAMVPNASASGRVGVKNGGTITAAAAELKAANGNIYALAVQNQGIIRATTVSHQGGHIWLTSDAGTVGNSGTLDASTTAPAGQGGGITLKSAKGTVSDTGRIVAEGGAGGTGGNADISGANVQFTGQVDLSAPGGSKGTLTLDPATIDVITGGGTDLTASTIDPGAIVAALNGANVNLDGTTSITVDSAIDASGNASAGNLTLTTPTLNLNAGIQLNGTLIGTASTVNVGASGLIQNGVDALAATGGSVNLTGGGAYNLTSEIVIDKNVVMNGNGAVIDGGDTTRDMEVDGGIVSLVGLTLSEGFGVSSAGASGATWNRDGGALLIYGQNTTANVLLTNCSVIGNTASSGGAIFNVSISGGSTTLQMFNCTVYGNTSGNGSALYNYGSSGGNASMTLTLCTVTGNIGNGAIYNTLQTSGEATVSVGSTILAGNTTNGGAESDYVNGGGGTLTDLGYNLYGQNGNAGGFIPGSLASTDILLRGSTSTVFGPYGDYGDGLDLLPLVAGSPALDAGNPVNIGKTDERGITRGALTQFTDAGVDIGAFQAQFVDVTANNTSVVYGEAPAFGYSVTGGATTAPISGEPALFTGATNVGSYPGDIQVGTLSATASYIVNLTPGNFTITPRPVFINPDPGQSKVYGTPDPVLTYTAQPVAGNTGLISNDTLSGNLSYTGANQYANVGNYTINAGTLANSNYTIELTTPALTFGITPATLAYVATPVTVAPGAAFPVFTGDVVGFLGSDTLANSTTGTPVFSTTEEPNAPVGSYAIFGSGLTANNYIFDQAAGNESALTIETPPTPPTPPIPPPSQPNTPVSQAIAQTSTSNTPVPNGSQPGTDATSSSTTSDSTSTPSVALAVNNDVYSISPNESIDASPAAAEASYSGGDSTGNLAQGSSFDPGLTENAGLVSVGQTTVLAQSGSTNPNATGPAATTPAGASGPNAGTTASAAAGTTASTATNPAGPGQTGPVTVIAPGQTIVIGGGKSANVPPPAPVQASFDQGFSPESRDTLSKAAGQ